MANQSVHWRLFSVHRKGREPDIVIFTTGRSGGTWLMELIAYCPGMRPISEPFSLSLVSHPRKAVFGDVDPSTGYPFSTVEPHIQQYIADILSGELDPFPAIKTLRKSRATFHFLTNRTVMKVCHGKGLIEFFDQHFDAQLLYLVREPVATISSMKRRGFNSKHQGFLRDQQFVKENLNDEQLQLANQIDENGSQLQKLALSWSLDNLKPHRRLQHNTELLMLSFEELVNQSEHSLQWLSEKFFLPIQPMKKRFKKASSTADIQPRATVSSGNTRDIDQVYEIVAAFGIDFYEPGAVLPRAPYLISNR